MSSKKQTHEIATGVTGGRTVPTEHVNNPQNGEAGTSVNEPAKPDQEQKGTGEAANQRPPSDS